MQRVPWTAVGLVLALGAAGARAQEGEVEVEEMVADGPRLGVEYGRSPTQVGFALSIEGGAAFSHALLVLTSDVGCERRALVALDEHGAARLVERNASRGMVIQARCVVPTQTCATVGAAVTCSAMIDLASQPQGPLALAIPGDIVISEIMKDPSFVTDSVGEWFEVRNRTTQAIDLEGWKITDAGTNSHTIHGASGTMIIPPKSYFVFGINVDPAQNGGVQVGYKYSSFTLANGADEVRLSDAAGVLVDVVSYDDGIFWPDVPGKSLTLSRALVDPAANDDGANWCSALSPMSGGNTDLATPRIANSNCP